MLFDFEKINRTDVVFNDKIICQSFKCDAFSQNDISICIPKNVVLCNNATICLRFNMKNTRRFQTLARITEFQSGKVNCRLNSPIVELPERRQYVKVRADLSCILDYYNADPIHVDIKDISLGGVFLKYKDEIPIGTVCNINLKDLGITTRLVIHRRQFDNSGYGCRFNKLTDKDCEVISRYVFSQQRKELKRM